MQQATRRQRSAVPIEAAVGDNPGMVDAEFLDWVAATAGVELGVCRAAPKLVPLAVEASTREFFRVKVGVRSFVAMHSPPATENNPRYVRLAALLRGYGLRTPTIHAADLRRGYLLLEDLGAMDFEGAYAGGEVAGPLTAAIDALARLQAVPPADAAAHIAPYAAERFTDELGIFREWLVERLLGLDAAPGFDEASAALVAAADSVPQCVVHRDFHCRNLIWRRQDGSVGVVDFQDALIGPCCYDLASLLRDCYHVFDEATVAAWRLRFLEAARPDCDQATFARAFDLVALQRQLKAVGIFARLHLARGRASHLADIVPVLRRSAAVAAGYAETRALAAWLAGDVAPAASRRLAALGVAA